jgi:hypothetical protein
LPVSNTAEAMVPELPNCKDVSLPTLTEKPKRNGAEYLR